MDKFTKKLRDFALEVAEYHPSDLEDEEEVNEWLEGFVDQEAEELKELL